MPTRKFNPLTPPFDLTADSVSDLTDHTKAVHDALGIDAHTVDGKHASDMSQISAGAVRTTLTYKQVNDFKGFHDI